MNTSQRTSNSDMILRTSEFSLGCTDSPETTSDIVAVLTLCSVHFVLQSPEDYIPLSASVLFWNSFQNYRTFDPLDLHGHLHLSLMPLGILRYTPSAFSSIQHLLADTCPSLMKTPLLTVVSIDPLDHSGESPEYRLH
ncbi:hypothetical protein EV363DRAFT_1396032 [Boletus edulis]|nr:hypothetical protein EV363DRAFT_1396032 [Boletus edulis]